MAGRSGAAAIEMELREAAVTVQKALPMLAEHIRHQNAALADSMDKLVGKKPTLDRRPDELVLSFAPSDDAAPQRTDVSEALGDIPYGVEVLSSGGQVVGMSLYLQ